MSIRLARRSFVSTLALTLLGALTAVSVTAVLEPSEARTASGRPDVPHERLEALSGLQEPSETTLVTVPVATSVPDPCADILDLHAGRGAADRQHWFNHLTYQDYARYWIACVHGWGEGEWNCLVALWNHESGWDPTQPNLQGSGAYGIPQALPGSKMASHGDDWRTNGRTQVRWGTRYIDDEYGSPSRINGGRCRGPY